MNERLPRTQVRRLPERQVMDRAVMLDVLRAGRLAHVGVADADGQPRVLPLAYGLEGDSAMLLHGATSSQLFRAMADGAAVCATVTFLDGLVIANSAFNSSMNYRSVMVFGRGEVVPEDEKVTALHALSEHIFPGHWLSFRPLREQEIKATTVIRLPLDDMSMKSREGGPDDAEDDIPTRWSGHIPFSVQEGEPVPGAHVQVAVPAHVKNWHP